MYNPDYLTYYKEHNMISIFAEFHLKPENIEEFLELVKPLIRASNEEAGCIKYELHKALNMDNTYMMVEEWKDQAAIDFHNQTEHFTSIVPRFNDFMTEEPKVILHSRTL